MTDEQFDDWFRRACLAFPGVTAYFAKKEPDEATAQTDFWRSKTRRLTLDQCDAALEAMFAAEKTPNSSDWFKAFLSTAKRYGNNSTVVKYHDRERLSECPNNCTLDGFVFVRDYSKAKFEYHRDRYRNMIDQNLPDLGYGTKQFRFTVNLALSFTEDDWREFIARRYPAAVLCDCAKGDRDEGKEKQRSARFNPERFTLSGANDHGFFPSTTRNGLVELP